LHIKNKSLFLLILIAVLLIFIPASFAQDNETNLAMDNESAVIETNIVQEEVLGASNDYYFNASVDNDNGDGSQNNPYKYLTAERIKSNCNIYLADGEYALDNNKSIEQVNFIGSNPEKTVLKYDGTIFTVWNSLTLNNLTIKDATVVDYLKLNATNVIFDGGYGNKPDSYGNNFGGAIACPYESDYYIPTVNINNCTFKNNYAVYGGAIYIDGGTLNIVDSRFINNYADNYGGSIAAENYVNVTVSESKFFNTKSLADAGGAIYTRDASLKISNVEIVNSSATFGGAITTLSTDVSLTYLTVENASAKWDGGAVYHMYGAFSSFYGKFNNNSAMNGGALFIDNSTNLILRANQFSYNHANFTAGAVYSILNSIKFTTFRQFQNIFNKNTAFFKNDEYISESLNLTIAGGNYSMYKNNASDPDRLPSYYSLRDYGLLTIPKDQQTSGNCWAFTAIAVLESAILKATGQSLDLSEENMKNVIARYSNYGWTIDTNDGGYDPMPIGYLTSWLGPVFESSDMFDDKGTLSPVLDSIMHVQNVVYLKRDNYLDNDEIKKAIMKYGAVGTSMMYDNWYFKWDGYYCWALLPGNHAVTIVGWDDNYSRNNFYGLPSDKGNGAWIVRNSWGPYWNDNGYFYVSYYDEKFAQPGIDGASYAIIFNDTIKYDKNYQYDIAGRTDYYYSDAETIWYKNIFHADDNEYLAGISTYFEKITNWTASVYVNGEIKSIKEGISNPGYYTIDLGDFISLNKGDTFEVQFKVTGFDPISFPISEKASLNTLIYKPAQSYFSLDGSNWIDLYDHNATYATHTYSSATACIKAFTFLNKINTALNLAVNSSELASNITATVIDQYGNLLNHGTVTFNLNDEKYTVNVTNGIAKIANLLNFGTNTINATFDATGYSASNNSTVIEIPKEKINMSVDISKYQNKVNLTVTVSQPINGTINLKYANKTYNESLVNGKYAFELELPNGYYEFNITLDDGQYEANASENFTIDVSKTFIDAGDLHVVDNQTIFSVRLTDESGKALSLKTIYFTLNNQTYLNITDSAGNAVLSLDLPLGDYDVISEFNGDEKYFNSNKSNSIDVKSEVELSLNIVPDRNTVLINVTLSKALNENISFVVNGENYYNMSDKGQASLYLHDLASKEYDVKVGLVNKTYYISEDKFANFNIKYNTTIIIPDISQHYVGDSFEINIYNGTEVNVTFNGNKTNIINNKLDIDTAKLPAGEYEIVASINWNGEIVNAVSNKFSIVKYASNISEIIFSDEYVIGQNTTVTVKMANNESGEINFEINNVNHTVALNNKTAILNISLPIDVYSLNVFYLGDNRYNTSSIAGKSFKVIDKAATIIAIDNLTKCYVGDELTITALASNGEKVIISVDGVNLGEDGKYIVGSEGIYTVTFKTNETAYYHAGFNETSFVAYKRTPEFNINLSSNDNYVGSEVIINVSCDVDCDYILLVNGKTIDGNKFTPDNAGIYTVTVISNETDRYYKSTDYAVYESVKRNCELNALGLEISEGENALINVTVTEGASGIILLEINGINYFSQIADNYALFNISGLTNGSYMADITYAGDDKFYGNFTEITVSVISTIQKSDIILLISDNVVNIELPENAAGNVTIKLDGVTVYDGDVKDLEDISLNDLNYGNHIIEAEYSGDEKYESASNYTVFAVEKITPRVIANYENGTISIEVPSDASGIVLVKIEDKQVYAQIKDGKATVNVDDLNAGEYKANVTFVGDNKYGANSTVVDVKVNDKPVDPEPIVPNVNITVPDKVKLGENSTIGVILPDDANGNVIVKVDGKEVASGPVENGTANVVLENLTPGAHLIEITYAGDDKYAPVSDAKAILVENETQPEDNNITVVVDGKEYPAEVVNGTVTVNTEPVEEDNNITVVVDGKEYPAEVVNGTVTVNTEPVDVDGNVTVVVDGKEYPAEVVNGTVTVNTEPVDVDGNVTVVVDGKEYPAEVVNGTVVVNTEPVDVDGNVTVVVDGREYSAEVVNGTVAVNTEPVNNVTVVVDGKEYSAEVVNGTATVKTNATEPFVKKNAFIEVDSAFTRVANDYYAGERGEFFYAVLKDSDGNVLANRTVSIAVNGPIYNVTTDDQGRAGLQVNFMIANIYTYALAFDGDDEYNAAPLASSKLTIIKKTITISASSKSFKVKAKKTIKVTLKAAKNPYDGKVYLKAGKKVTLKVNGKTYSAKANKKGVAKFTLKLTKKGKYIAKIKFAGDKTYISAKKSISISIK